MHARLAPILLFFALSTPRECAWARDLYTPRSPTQPSESSVASALRHARAALADDPRTAKAVLDGVRDRCEPVCDYVRYVHALAAIASGDHAGAVTTLRSILNDAPRSPVAASAAAKLAARLQEQGDLAAVLALAERYVDDAEDRSAAAELALAAGSMLATSDPPAALRWLTRARDAEPRSPAAIQALSVTTELRRLFPSFAPSSVEELLAEATLARREGDRRREIEWLDRLLRRFPDSRHALAARLTRARSLAALEGRAAAIRWLEQQVRETRSSSERAALVYTIAVHRWNLDETEAAVDAFEETIRLAPASTHAQRAHYALGRIHEAAGRYTTAIRAYERAARGGDAAVAGESAWRTGWVAYLAGHYTQAASRFAAVAEAARDRHDRSARSEALYWQARSLEAAGVREQAIGLYRVILQTEPDGFYAYLAEQRCRARARGPEPISIPLGRTPPAAAAYVERARILDAADWRTYALAELRRALAASSPADRRMLLPVLHEHGAFADALRAALDLYRRGVVSEAELYPYLYPHAYADIVEREASARGIDPFLVYSLIRQESLFDPHAVSPADALGLMQLLLSTARRMAAKLGIDVLTRADLFRPELNIRLGTEYLAELSARFDGDPVWMLAGYNAGERAAERWRARLTDVDLDSRIEQISYRETRGYVKNVLRNYRNYRRLYGGAAGLAGTQTVDEATR